MKLTPHTAIVAMLICIFSSSTSYADVCSAGTDHTKNCDEVEVDPCRGKDPSVCSCEKDDEGVITGCSGGGD